VFHKSICDLSRQTLLELQSSGKHLYGPCDLAQAHYRSIGNIRHMHFSVKRKHMMLAERIKGDVFLYYHLIIIHMKALGKMHACILIHSAGDLLVHPGDPVRSLQKSLSLRIFSDPLQAIQASYDAGVTDEFMEPVICTRGGNLEAGDSVIFFNFRPDRARELTRALVDPAFAGLKRPRGCFPLHFVCTTEYDATMPNVTVAFPHEKLKNIFGEYLSQLGLTQLRIAETEKYAHVTFFFNGGQEAIFPGEDRCLIPSPKVATYDLQPEMSAPAITDEVIRRMESGKYDVIILNFANCDMVGHTGVYDAAVEAVETVDNCVARVVRAAQDMGGVVLITADHGNAEQMLDQDGQPFTAHTTNPVPFCIVGADVRLRDGRLADIAPTMLDLMGLDQPEEMDGKTLILN